MPGRLPEKPMLTSDFRDILCEFSASKVEFILVGAHALAAHGVVRATGDLDLWIRPTEDNAKRVWEALVSFGAPLDAVNPTVFSTPGIVYQMGVPPCRIDIITEIDGVGFQKSAPQTCQTLTW